MELGSVSTGAPTSTKSPYGTRLADHNDFVRNYFITAGLPVQEILSVDGHVGGGAGSLMGQAPTVFEPTRFYSVLSRGFDGIPIVGSFATARVDADSEIVEEAVYWPAIPQDILNEAKVLASTLSDTTALSAFRASLPNGPGRVCIRHSSGASTGPFQVYAAFSVSTSSGPRDFDGSGAELHIRPDPFPTGFGPTRR